MPPHGRSWGRCEQTSQNCMKIPILLLTLTATIALSGATAAVPITGDAAQSATDKSKLAVLEQAIFDKIEKDGIEQFFRMFREALTSADADQAGQADALCGQLTEVQMAREEPLGSHFTRRWYVAIHDSCILHWRIAYKRHQGEWITDTLFFNTDYNKLND